MYAWCEMVAWLTVLLSHLLLDGKLQRGVNGGETAPKRVLLEITHQLLEGGGGIQMVTSWYKNSFIVKRSTTAISCMD